MAGLAASLWLLWRKRGKRLYPILTPALPLKALIAFTSVGALYAQLLQSTPLNKGILFFATIPVSVMENLVRLMMLCLITYYLGEAAAEGFLHDSPGSSCSWSRSSRFSRSIS